MLLSLAWIVLIMELFLALSFGAIFWYVWSHVTMTSFVKIAAITVYAIGCIACLLLSVVIPL